MRPHSHADMQVPFSPDLPALALGECVRVYGCGPCGWDELSKRNEAGGNGVFLPNRHSMRAGPLRSCCLGRLAGADRLPNM